MNIFTIREALIRNYSSYHHGLIPFPEFEDRHGQLTADPQFAPYRAEWDAYRKHLVELERDGPLPPPPLKPCREESGARAATNEVIMLDLTSSPPKQSPAKRIPQALSRHTKGSTSASTSSQKAKPKPQKLGPKAKGAATTAQIVKVLDYQKRHKLTLTATVKYFNNSPNHRDIPILSQPKLTQWRKKEDEFRALLESGQGSMRRNNSVMHPNLEQTLEIWCTQALEQNTTITTDVLRLKGQQFADKLEIRDFAFSNGWLQGFKKRHNLRSYKFHGEGEKVDAKTLEEERKRVVDLTNKYDPKDIFNMDETGLFYAMRPSSGLARNGRNGVKMNKTRITFAFTVNADGSERLPPFIIGTAAKPRSFNKKPASYYSHYYRSNKKAWMTGELYVEWLKAWDLELRGKGRKMQLWLDNFSGHTRDVDSITNIEFHWFAPNMTSRIQPLDQGIIANFKANYRRRFIRNAIARFDDGQTGDDIYAIDQLRAVNLARQAWNDIRPETIANCWRHAQILSDRKNKGSTDHTPFPNGRGPIDGDRGIFNAMNALKTANDELVEKGILTSNEKMSIHFLVDVDEENFAGGAEMTDQEIVDLVIAEELEENCEGELEGGEEEAEIELRPAKRTTLKEAISALDVFLRFAMNGYSGPTDLISFEDEARRIRGTLVAEQDAARIQTTMTSYFQRQ